MFISFGNYVGRFLIRGRTIQPADSAIISLKNRGFGNCSSCMLMGDWSVRRFINCLVPISGALAHNAGGIERNALHAQIFMYVMFLCHKGCTVVLASKYTASWSATASDLLTMDPEYIHMRKSIMLLGWKGKQQIRAFCLPSGTCSEICRFPNRPDLIFILSAYDTCHEAGTTIIDITADSRFY